MVRRENLNALPSLETRKTKIAGKDQSLKDWWTRFDQIGRDRDLRGEQKTTWENREKNRFQKVDWRRVIYNREEQKRGEQTDRGVLAIKMGPTVWWPARRTGG